MLLSSGVTYGFRRTLPHIAGILLSKRPQALPKIA
jgi:hypothetical protein